MIERETERETEKKIIIGVIIFIILIISLFTGEYFYFKSELEQSRLDAIRYRELYDGAIDSNRKLGEYNSELRGQLSRNEDGLRELRKGINNIKGITGTTISRIQDSRQLIQEIRKEIEFLENSISRDTNNIGIDSRDGFNSFNSY
jgi:peptidoglycan hydrolase CwlO-like protein